jgi:GTP-binding protein
MPAIIKAYDSYTKTIQTSILNDVIRDAVALHEAPSYRNRRLKIYFVRQSDTCPPKFQFNVNDKGLVHFSYYRYLENKIRENIDLVGTPIILQFKNKNEDDYDE